MVLGIPMGHPEFVRSRLAAVSAKHDHLVSQIVGMSDSQCAWMLLLYCAAARLNYMVRVVHPALSARFAGPPRCDHAADPLGCRQPPTFTRWFGSLKCSSDSKRRVLGQLGGQSPHDPKVYIQQWRVRF